MRGCSLFVVVVRFHCLMNVNSGNRSQNTVGRTRSFVLRTKGVNNLFQTFFLLTGCLLKCGELMTEFSYDFLEVYYFFF